MPARSVVVIGASAGGLEGLLRIVQDLEGGLPAAFCVVMHLSPTTPSRLPEILTRRSAYPATIVETEEALRPAHIYIAAPDRHLVIDDGRVLASAAPRENHHRPSVDVLFRSAAIAYRERTVGVILSGTLDDGTAGLRWIKRFGGRAIVQDPAEARFAGMPASAIANVAVDQILPAEQIAAQLAEMVRSGTNAASSGNGKVDAQGAPRQPEGELEPSAFVCPDCGGTLFELGASEALRFRCRVGHAYGPEALHTEQARNLEESLWTAIRSLEEHADMSRRLAGRSRSHGMERAAAQFEAGAREAAQKAQIVRQAVASGARVLPEPVDDTA